jgi:hypothetical protein
LNGPMCSVRMQIWMKISAFRYQPVVTLNSEVFVCYSATAVEAAWKGRWVFHPIQIPL